MNFLKRRPSVEPLDLGSGAPLVLVAHGAAVGTRIDLEWCLRGLWEGLRRVEFGDANTAARYEKATEALMTARQCAPQDGSA